MQQKEPRLQRSSGKKGHPSSNSFENSGNLGVDARTDHDPVCGAEEVLGLACGGAAGYQRRVELYAGAPAPLVSLRHCGGSCTLVRGSGAIRPGRSFPPGS